MTPKEPSYPRQQLEALSRLISELTGLDVTPEGVEKMVDHAVRYQWLRDHRPVGSFIQVRRVAGGSIEVLAGERMDQEIDREMRKGVSRG